MKMKTFFFTLITLSLTAAYGDSQLDFESLNKRVTALENKPITPPVGSCAQNGYGVYLYGAPLLWRVEQDGMEYAITGSYTLSTQGTSFYRLDIKNGKTHHPDFNWDWGFRVGIGYYLPYDGWDLSTSWTRFHDRTSDSLSRSGDPNANNVITTGGSGEFISPFWVAQLFDPPGLMNEAKARWNGNIDLIDLELGREFLVSKFLALKPIIGLRNGWINQKYNLSFLSYNFPVAPAQIERQIKVRMKNDFWGIGGRFGLRTRWLLGKGFCLYGNGAFSVMEGRFKVRYKLDDLKPVPTTSLIDGGAVIIVGNLSPPYDDSYEATKRIHTTVTMADFGLGFCWDKSFYSGKFCLSIWLGYEQNIFFGQNRFMNHQYDFTLISLATTGPQEDNGPNFFTDRGNMTTSGATGGMSFTF